MKAASSPPAKASRAHLNFPRASTVEVVASGLNAATALEVAPDGRVFVCEQTGALRVVKKGKLLPEPFCALTRRQPPGNAA